MQVKTMRYPYTPIMMDKIRNTDNTKWDDVQQQKPSFAAGGNAKWYSHFGRQFGGLLCNWTYFHRFAVNQKLLSQINSFFKHSTFIFDKSIQIHFLQSLQILKQKIKVFQGIQVGRL